MDYEHMPSIKMLGQNQAHGEGYWSVSEIPPPSKTSQGKINVKNKVRSNYITHKQEEPRSSELPPLFPHCLHC